MKIRKAVKDDFMNLTQEQKEQIDFCKRNQIFVPQIDLSFIIQVLTDAGLPQTKEMILNKENLSKYILNLKKFFNKQSKDYLNKLYKFLTPANDVENASVYFIYGTNKSIARVKYGAKLYNSHPANIVLTDKDITIEYKKVLLENGVKEKDIFIEPEAGNFIENAFYSIKMAKKNNLSLVKVAVVSASLVALRALLMTKIFLSSAGEVYSTPVERDITNIENDPTSPENWYKNDLGIKMFLSEVAKLYVLQKEGIFS